MDNIEISGPSLTLHDGLPAIIEEDGSLKHTTAPELFDTGGGAYIGYAENWQTTFDDLFPENERDAAIQEASEKYGLSLVDGQPSIWLLVAMTLEK